MNAQSAFRERGRSTVFFVIGALVGLHCAAGAPAGSREVTAVREPPTPTSGAAGQTDPTRDAGNVGAPAGSAASSAGTVNAVPTDAAQANPDAGPATPTTHWLITTGDLNLRKGPSTSDAVLRVMPKGSLVQLLEVTPMNAFLHVDHQGLTGWAHQDYLRDANAVDAGGVAGNPAGASMAQAATTQPPSTVAAAIERAKAGVGFSYWWAHGRWLSSGVTASNMGSCSGSCPNCTHSGSYGADCSGYVGKIWQVPASNGDITTDGHPYSTASFVNDTSLWSTISRADVKLGDSLVYNNGSNGHIFLYSAGDGWGSMDVYECKSCAAGCVFDNRTAGSAYKAIRRTGY